MSITSLYLVGTLITGWRCTMLWCDLDLTFDHAVMTLTYKNLLWAISQGE